ncbi:MAG: hypothetical protein HYS15_03460 [Candidatus Spechtbacteria bacterium]|nr:hypothetical protein [Candidatus Spechtbacteria bacterium]
MGKVPHIINAIEFNRNLIDAVLDRAAKIKCAFKNNSWITCDPIAQQRMHMLEGRTMMLLFDQPSLRTYGLFTTAMRALGGNVDGWQNFSRDTSISKGESLQDTGRVISHYPGVSVLVIRHPDDRAAVSLARYSSVPVINAGSKLEHPTQALKDLFTIREELRKIDNLHVVVTGDLTGRAVRSFLCALSYCNSIRVSLISPPRLRLELPRDVKSFLESRGIQVMENVRSLANVVKDADVLYVMRPQTENWPVNSRAKVQDRKEALIHYFDHCGVTHQVVENLPAHARVLHPLPRTDELPTYLDEKYGAYVPEPTSQLAFFRQSDNGGPMGIAILEMLHSGEWAELLK